MPCALWDGIENVKIDGRLRIEGSSNLQDISAVYEHGDINTIYIDDSQFNQFTTKASANGALCTSIRNDNTDIYVYSNSGNGDRQDVNDEICYEQ